MIDAVNPSIRLEVDGGLNLENIGRAARSGADTFVAGSAIFNSENYKTTISQMRDCLLYTSPSPRDQEASRMPSSA